MLPESMDPDTLRQVAIGGLIVLGLLVIFVAVTVQKLVAKLVIIGLLVAAGGAVWWQRHELRDCAETCECRFFRLDVPLPGDAC